MTMFFCGRMLERIDFKITSNEESCQSENNLGNFVSVVDHCIVTSKNSIRRKNILTLDKEKSLKNYSEFKVRKY